MVEATDLNHLVEILLRDGSMLVTQDHAPLQKQSDLALFNTLSARVWEVLGDEDFAMNMAPQEAGWFITLKVGDEADEAPDFSPPEPKLP